MVGRVFGSGSTNWLQDVRKCERMQWRRLPIFPGTALERNGQRRKRNGDGFFAANGGRDKAEGESTSY